MITIKTKNLHPRPIVLAVILLSAAIGSFAQQAKPEPAPTLAPNVRQEVLKSKLMARDMPYRVILPAAYDAKGAERFPTIYLLHGLTGHFNNWTDKTAVATYARSRNYIIVTPEGGDSWYTDSSTKPDGKWESYIVRELIPEIDKRYRTRADRGSRVIAGLSMGGFGALKYGLKYPDMFALAGSFSGAVFASSYRTAEDLPKGSIRTTLIEIFGEADSQTRKDNDILAMIRDATPEKIKSMPFLYVDCGTEDFLFGTNQDLAKLLAEKKVPHEYRQLPGTHNWKYWDQQVRSFFDVADRITARPQPAEVK